MIIIINDWLHLQMYCSVTYFGRDEGQSVIMFEYCFTVKLWFGITCSQYCESILVAMPQWLNSNLTPHHSETSEPIVVKGSVRQK